MENSVWVAIGTDEVIIGKVGKDGEKFGFEEYFRENLGRDLEEYDVEIKEMPFSVSSIMRIW